MTNSRVNSQFVIATLAEFVRVWDLGEDASLHLETTKGHATMAFTCKLGPPSAPHPNPTFPPPTPPPWPRHHRGPAQREKNRQRAARYQASKRDAAVAAATSSSLPTSVSEVTVTNSTPSTTTLVSTPAIIVPVMASSTISPCQVVPNATSTADPAVPSKFIISLVSEVKELPGLLHLTNFKCDKCQYFGPWEQGAFGGLREHREEKHRIWDCLCCGATFPNKINFGKHLCVLHPLGMPYLGRPKL